MQKGEWLPFSRRFSFYIPWPVKSALHFTGLHSAFFILHSSFCLSTPWVRGNGAHAKGECRRKKEECRKGNGSRSAGCFHSAFPGPWSLPSTSLGYILHSSFFILPFHSLGEGERGSLFVEVAADDLEEGVRGKGLLEEAALGAP